MSVVSKNPTSWNGSQQRDGLPLRHPTKRIEDGHLVFWKHHRHPGGVGSAWNQVLTVLVASNDIGFKKLEASTTSIGSINTANKVTMALDY